MLELSRGQELALQQLNEIAERSNGALEIRGEPQASQTKGSIRVPISLETRDYRTPNGLAFRDRERLNLYLHADFPLCKPDLHFDHKRFIGTPHVNWGSVVCLYQSIETEYDPADGLYGFFDRVQEWMSAAGAGQLDPEDAPLHPPVAYTTSSTRFVIKANAPQGQPAGAYWLGRADLLRVRPDRLDVTGWTHLDDWGDPAPNQVVAAAVMFNQPLAMEYPTKVDDLIKLIEGAGMEFGTLYRLLRLFSLLSAEGEPAYFILGAPMRRKAAGESLRPHLTVWKISADPLKSLRAIIRSHGEDVAARGDLAKWMVEASVKWCGVLEDRPEIVNRRDGGTLLSGIAGKRILLLGCGAIGSATAESVARAGASRLHLVDYGIVKPGILVRQRFSDPDIGLPKATALHAHIEAIGLACQVTSEVSDLSYRTLPRFNLSEWDLVIDVTASTSVARRLEEELKEHELLVPLISLSVSAAAENGSVAVKMPGYRGGPHQIARQAKLEAFSRDAGHPLVGAFWPKPGQVKVFQPEPGCSAPTFIGSATDIDHHTAGLFNLGLRRTQTLPRDSASLDLVAAPWVESEPKERPFLGYEFAGYSPLVEQNRRYTVLRSNVAARGMATELRRIARARSDKVETGGLMFGEVDDAHQRIWVDSVSGPPADSQASEMKFLCGTAGTKELAEFKARASGQSSRFIGIWHTHPISRGRPSRDDLTAMVQLLYGQQHPPRQVVMLIVGFAATKPVENYYLYHRNEFVLIEAEEPE